MSENQAKSGLGCLMILTINWVRVVALPNGTGWSETVSRRNALVVMVNDETLVINNRSRVVILQKDMNALNN